MQVKIYPLRSYIKNNFSVSNDKNFFKPTCFYVNFKGHASNACYIRNIGLPSGNYVWVDKGTNPRGSKENWVPKKKFNYVL